MADDDGESFPPEAVIFVSTFDDVVSGNLAVTESLVGSTLSALSCLECVDPVIDILVEWAVSEFPASRDWETLRFTALILAGIFRMSPLGLRRELLLLLRLESLPWHLRLLVGTHLMEEDPFTETNCCCIDDPLLPLIAKKRTHGTTSELTTATTTKTACPGSAIDKLSVELVAHLMLDKNGMVDYKKELNEVEAKLKEFTKRYPWAAVVVEEAAEAALTFRQ